jgi:hypothetical protein
LIFTTNFTKIRISNSTRSRSNKWIFQNHTRMI